MAGHHWTPLDTPGQEAEKVEDRGWTIEDDAEPSSVA
jgi:hypothetical protein